MFNNTSAVVKFEIMKQLRKPIFWLTILSFPLIVLISIGVTIYGKTTAPQQIIDNQRAFKTTPTKIAISDKYRLINPIFVPNMLDVTFIEDYEQAKANFKKDANFQALIIYPQNLKQKKIEVYTRTGKNRSDTVETSHDFEQLAKGILTNSVKSQISPSTLKLLEDLESNAQLYSQAIIIDQHGQAYNPFSPMIVPGIILATFLVVIFTTINQTLVATTEEKENRVAEMILTTITAQALIFGKIITLTSLALIQAAALLIPMIVFLILAPSLNILPNTLLSYINNITFDSWSTFFGIAFLLLGLIINTSIAVRIGSSFSTAQEAAQIYGPFILIMTLPIFSLNAILLGSNNAAINFLSFFPPSAPATLLIRNLAGTLSITEGFVGLIILIVFGAVITISSVKGFKKSAFGYTKFSFKSFFNLSN